MSACLRRRIHSAIPSLGYIRFCDVRTPCLFLSRSQGVTLHDRRWRGLDTAETCVRLKILGRRSRERHGLVGAEAGGLKSSIGRNPGIPLPTIPSIRKKEGVVRAIPFSRILSHTLAVPRASGGHWSRECAEPDDLAILEMLTTADFPSVECRGQWRPCRPLPIERPASPL